MLAWNLLCRLGWLWIWNSLPASVSGVYTTESQVQATISGLFFFFKRVWVFVVMGQTWASYLLGKHSTAEESPHLGRGSKHECLRKRMLPLFTPSPGSRAVTEESGKGWKIRAHFAKVEIKLFKAKWWHREGYAVDADSRLYQGRFWGTPIIVLGFLLWGSREGGVWLLRRVAHGVLCFD